MLATQMQNAVSGARAARVSRAAANINARPVAFARVARKASLAVNASVAVATPTAVPTAQQPLAIYVGVPSVAPTAVPSTGFPEPTLPTAQEKAEIAAAFDRWNAALQTGCPEEVAKLYAPDAILLPTVSNQVRTDHVSKVDYFTAFLQIKPYGTIDEAYIRFLHPSKDIAANSGIYTFRIVKEGKEQTVTARYSFIYRKVQGEWKIIEHHSSAMPEPTGEAEVAALFDTWNAALQTGDPEKVADLYAEDAILLPTVSNQVRTTRAERVDYFKNFLQIKPYGTINQSHIRFISPSIAANSGVYTFRITRDGESSEVTARYSFVYRKTKGAWKIIEHHSSAMPEKVVAASNN